MDRVTSVRAAGGAPQQPTSPFGALSEDIDRIVDPTNVSTESADTPSGSQRDEDIQGLAPFAIEDFDDIVGSESFEFGVLPWEQQDGVGGLDVQELLAEVTETDEIDEAELVSLDPELPHGVNDHLEINQELSNAALDPQFAQRMAEIEQAARQNLDKLHRDQGRDPAETVAAADVGASIPDLDEPHSNIPSPTIELLADDAGLFRRARSAKNELIAQGAIKGDREFAAIMEPEPVVEPAFPAPEPDIPLSEQEHFVAEAEPESTDQIGQGHQDIHELSVAVETNPNDDNARWQYAEALREQGQIHASFSEYRWLIRHAPARHNAIIAALEWCAFEDREADLAHRLLADIYRRRGDSAQARNHASMAMATRRLMREVRM